MKAVITLCMVNIIQKKRKIKCIKHLKDVKLGIKKKK